MFCSTTVVRRLASAWYLSHRPQLQHLSELHFREVVVHRLLLGLLSVRLVAVRCPFLASSSMPGAKPGSSPNPLGAWFSG